MRARERVGRMLPPWRTGAGLMPHKLPHGLPHMPHDRGRNYAQRQEIRRRSIAQEVRGCFHVSAPFGIFAAKRRKSAIWTPRSMSLSFSARTP